MDDYLLAFFEDGRLILRLRLVGPRLVGIAVKVAIMLGLIAILFVQLFVLYMPTSLSASSNMLFLKLIITNCAFLVRSAM